MIRRKTRALVAVGAVLSLLAACGTRLDHDEIVRSASGVGAGGVIGENGAALPGEFGAGEVLGEAGDVPGAAGNGPASDVAGSGTAAGGTRGTGASAGQPGKQGGAGGSGPANGAPIVIGSVGTYSGPVGVAYKDSPRALQAWAATVNAKGGIGGRPVKVVVFDDGGDSSKARSHVQTLVEQHKAVAMVASQTTAQNMASWLPYVQEKRFPVIGECGQHAHKSPMVFSPCPTLVDAAYGTVLIGAQQAGKGKRFGALFCTESDDCAFVEDHWYGKGQVKAVGLSPGYHAKISITAADFTAECIQARNDGVEVFAVIADAQTVGRVASSCQRQGFNPQYLQPDVTIGADMPSKPALANVLGATRVFPFTGVNSSATQEFAAAWGKYGGGSKPAGSAAIGWSAAKIFETVARAAGADISRETLIKQLQRISGNRFGDLTVPLTFTAKGPNPGRCMYLMKGSGGKWTAPQGDKPICF